MNDLLKTDQMGLIAIRENPNDWFAKCTKKLQAIANLESNWDSYGSERPDSVSLHYAYAFLHLLRDKVNVSEPAITANPNGNICFEWDNEVFHFSSKSTLPDAATITMKQATLTMRGQSETSLRYFK